METLWFCLVAIMIAGYVVLDGFDIGAGIVHLFAARTELERKRVLASIGPVWDGNEVWLLAGGGTLYFAFPALYASSFSGFYLPLMMVLWLLILRGIAIEFRNHVTGAVWVPLWDTAFAVASLLLALFYGAALGNVVRGVPLDPNGEFFLPLWTHFGISGDVGILDWYTVLVGVLAVLTLTMHGALWVNYKTDDNVAQRSRVIAKRAWIGVAVLTLVVTWATFSIQPQVLSNFAAQPWGLVFPALTLGGLFGVARFLPQPGCDLKAFLASCGYIAGMLTSAAFGVFPYVLPSNQDASRGLTVFNSAAAPYGLTVGLFWWIPGMLLALAYAFFLYRRFAGKVVLSEGSH
jgi:cytochrome d ubiquinol oxidase subunit II